MTSRALDVALVVEDELSLAVMLKVLAFSERGYTVLRPLVERGVDNIRKSLTKYRNASRALAHVVVVDLDEAACAPLLRAQWGLVTLPDRMLFRVAVREVEAWLLADRAGFANFAGILPSKISQTPEALSDPKQALLNFVRSSRNRRLVQEIVPKQGTSMSKGRLYNERLGEFVRNEWDVATAMQAAPSLQRTVMRLKDFLG
ncbi:hypothetical protein BH11PSE13_BH11PSE13_26850 [soil metagenome]